MMNEINNSTVWRRNSLELMIGNTLWCFLCVERFKQAGRPEHRGSKVLFIQFTCLVMAEEETHFLIVPASPCKGNTKTVDSVTMSRCHL